MIHIKYYDTQQIHVSIHHLKYYDTQQIHVSVILLNPRFNSFKLLSAADIKRLANNVEWFCFSQFFLADNKCLPLTQKLLTSII